PMVKTAAIAAMSGCSTVRLRTWPPVPRQELVDLAGRVSSDPGQHVGQPGLRIDIVHLGGDDQAVHRGGALPAAIGTGEQPRLSCQAACAQRSFRPGVWGDKPAPLT